MRDILEYRVGEAIWHARGVYGLVIQPEYDLVSGNHACGN